MRHKEAGFTLTEVIIATVLVSIMVTIIAGFGLNTLRSYSINSAYANLLADANLATEIINRDIRLSANVDQNNRWGDNNAPAAPDNLLSWESTDEVLVLATTAEDGDGNMLFADASNYITEKNNHIYYVSNGELRRRVVASSVEENNAITTCPDSQSTDDCPADSVFAEGVVSFFVDYIDRNGVSTTPDNARAVEVTLELSDEAFGETITVEQQARMVFRNE